MKARDRHPGIAVEGGGDGIADRVTGVGCGIRDLVAVERGRHVDLVVGRIENDPPGGRLPVRHVHHLDRHRPQIGVPVTELHQVGTKQGEAVIHGIDPVADCGRGIGAVGDDLRHRPLRVAEMLRPCQHVVPDVALAARFLFMNAEIADARQRAIEERVEGVGER